MSISIPCSKTNTLAVDMRICMRCDLVLNSEHSSMIYHALLYFSLYCSDQLKLFSFLMKVGDSSVLLLPGDLHLEDNHLYLWSFILCMSNPLASRYVSS